MSKFASFKNLRFAFLNEASFSTIKYQFYVWKNKFSVVRPRNPNLVYEKRVDLKGKKEIRIHPNGVLIIEMRNYKSDLSCDFKKVKPVH